MITFGQRLKILRKEASLTQGDLAEQLMVAVQTVSKWECDTSMPDISQLIPLSAILGVTTDCLLGIGGNEKEDTEKLLAQINDLANHYNCESYENNANYKAFELYREYTKKHPLDYWGKYHCSQFAFEFLINSKFAKKYEIPKDEEESLYNEGLKLLLVVVNRDTNIDRLANARNLLVRYYLYKDEFAKAEAVAEETPDIWDLQTSEYLEIYDRKGDYEKCLEIAEENCFRFAQSYIDALWKRARRISIFGNVRKQEAIDAWLYLEETATLMYEHYKDSNWYGILVHSITFRSNDHIGISEFEKAIEAAEKIRNISIRHYNYMKDKDTSTDELKLIKSIAQHALKRCYQLSLGEPDNIIDRNPRFRKCQEDIEALN